MIVYDIEKFVIEQMFRPYQSLLIPTDNLPTDEEERKIAYEKRKKQCENELRKHPENIIPILQNNKEAYRCVFRRLAKLDFKFYKWLQHPVILQICSITLVFQKALKERENKCL